jgi:hypothetical protein
MQLDTLPGTSRTFTSVVTEMDKDKVVQAFIGRYGRYSVSAAHMARHDRHRVIMLQLANISLAAVLNGSSLCQLAELPLAGLRVNIAINQTRGEDRVSATVMGLGIQASTWSVVTADEANRYKSNLGDSFVTFMEAQS